MSQHKDTNAVPAIAEPTQFCTECGQVHEFRRPKFAIGQRVRLLHSKTGYHHKDKTGQETVIVGIVTFMTMPCDEPEYRTELGDGAILESRLDAV